VASILLSRCVEVTMPDRAPATPSRNVSALVLAESVSEADALADGLRGSYGIEVLAVGSPGAARMALIGGDYDLLLAPGGAEVDWVAEVAPQVTVVLLGYATTAPSVPSLLIIPDWPQPLDSLVRAINWHLETWSGPQQAVPTN
jgi:hypothetical protein